METQLIIKIVEIRRKICTENAQNIKMKGITYEMRTNENTNKMDSRQSHANVVRYKVHYII